MLFSNLDFNSIRVLLKSVGPSFVFYKTYESNNLVEPSGLEFILKDEPVNPQANPALAKLEAGVEGTFQLL